MTACDFTELHMINVSVAKITRHWGNKRKLKKSLPFKMSVILFPYILLLYGLRKYRIREITGSFLLISLASQSKTFLGWQIHMLDLKMKLFVRQVHH